MNHILFTMINGIGALGFLLAALWSFANYHNTDGFSSYWLLFCIATGTGFLWATARSMQLLGFYAGPLDMMHLMLLVIMSSILSAAGLATYYSSLTRKIE